MVFPTLLAGAIAAGLAVYAWRQRPKRAAVPFSLLMVGLAIWSLAYGVELGVTARDQMILLDKIAFVGSVIVPTAWLLLALEYAGYEKWRSRWILGLFTIEPLVTLGLVWTNEFHGLIWQQLAVDASGPVTVLELTFGPAYWGNFAYSYLLMGGGILVLASVVVRASRIHRRQSLIVLLGTVIPFSANAAFHLVPRLNPWPNVDLTTVAFAVTGLCYALALFRFRLLDLVPVARDHLIAQLDDGVVVLGDDGEIRDMNPAAQAALPDATIGASITATALANGEGVTEGYRTLEVEGESRAYDISVTPITDFRGTAAGRFVVLHDITQLEILRSHEQRLSVLNRVLRHNIRNELTVIQGHSALLADTVDDSLRQHVDPIERATDRVVSISDQARHIEATLADGERKVTPVDVRDSCDAVVNELQETVTAADISVTGPDGIWATAAGRDQLETAITALVRNAVEHHPSEAAQVQVRLEAQDATVCVAVADDGPGIPSMERRILDGAEETSLEHGSGLGLWLVRWIVEASNGDVTYSPNDPTGSVVTLELQRAMPPADT
ncbi:histidine kinase N-terminal 7TM domain-containing protein [Halobacteriales archaeon Cl-PHB]